MFTIPEKDLQCQHAEVIVCQNQQGFNVMLRCLLRTDRDILTFKGQVLTGSSECMAYKGSVERFLTFGSFSCIAQVTNRF